MILVFLFLSFLQAVSTAGGNDFDVLHYDAAIRPDFIDKSLSGAVNIQFISRRAALTAVELDATELTIEEVKEGDAVLRFGTGPGKLSIQLAHPANNGETRTISIRYHTRPTRAVNFYPDHMYAAYATHRWMPCRFGTGDKAAISLRLTIPAEMKAVANGKLIGQQAVPGGSGSSDSSDQLIQQQWQHEMPIAPYIFGFAVGRFTEVIRSSGKVKLRYLTRGFDQAQIDKIFAETADILNFFEQRSGVSYPFDTYTQVLAAGNPGQEMSGFTVIGERYGQSILKEPQADRIFAHEFAHQWWGNAVTCANWNDFWLNEGIADFMMSAYREHRHGRAAYDADLQQAREQYAKLRAEGRDRPLSYPDPVPESQAGGYIVYDKGALMLHLLRFELGEDAFWNGLRRFTKENFGGSVTTAQFQKAMEAAGKKSLSHFFSQWIYGPDSPELMASHRWEQGQVIIELQQQQPRQYPLRIAVETENGRKSRRIELHASRHEVRLPARTRPLSIRVDDGGFLPVKVRHERDATMLLYQLAHEPDVPGRVDALRELQTRTSREPQLRPPFIAALQERVKNDSSPLIRQYAQTALNEINR